MPKIVIDAREYPTSTGRYIRKLLEYLEKIDANSDRQYLVLIKSPDFDTYQPKAQNFSKVKANFKEFTFSEQIGLLRLIRNLQPDLVHFGITQQPLLYSGKTITTMHDLTAIRFNNPTKNLVVFKIKQLIYAYAAKRVARKSNKVITISNYVKNDLINYTGINPDKLIMTLESADQITAEAKVYKPLEGSTYIMYVGRSQPHKNLERLIQAYRKIKQTHPELKLVMVGKKDALSEMLETYAKQHGISGIEFTGYVSEGQLRWLYENTACYCFPSLSEGFGLPSLEAMKHGAPVASSNATCLPEVNGDAAHYFDPLDVTDMASKINEVLSDEVLRKSLITKGYKQVKKYSWRRMAEQTLVVYKNVLGD